ncbi:MAG: ribosomal protein S18 acetylase RimI-like enzyme [Roseivirga sp.]|jgi:ribosomal protein S18 acetylase RimI-like enzyme
MNYIIIEGSAGPHSEFPQDKISAFLFNHLEKYGDPLEEIAACLDYVFHPDKGGFVAIAHDDDSEIHGAVIINNTGMSGYIPENILVYIAVNAALRGQGLGQNLMQMALENAVGNVALHVEADNPAKRLYERLGFTNKYLEMRYTKS